MNNALNRPWRWGILGTAQISLEIIKAIREGRDCGELRAVASRNPLKAQAWAERHNIPLAFGSYSDLLNSGEVDLIYNPLPNALHAEWTIQALETGHSVLCEKPIAADALEARAMQQAAAKAGRYVAEAFMYRFHPQWSRVKELLNNEVIGSVTSMHSQFTFMLDDRSAIAASKELAGGALMDVGCYCINFSRMIADCEPGLVAAFERRETVDDTLLGLLEFPNGILAQFETSIANYERHRAEIAGTIGAIILDSPWVPGKAPARIKVYRPDLPAEEIVIPPTNSYQLEVEDFVAVCRNRSRPRWPISDAVANMAVIDALLLSARTKRAIQPEY